MPFYVVPIEHHERAGGVIRPDAGTLTSEYATRAGAEAAEDASTERREKQREAWSRAYGQPFPGDDYHIVEAASALRACIYVRQLTNGEEPGNPMVGPGKPLRMRGVQLRTDENIVRAMPSAGRAAFKRAKEHVPRPLPLDDDATPEELEA